MWRMAMVESLVKAREEGHGGRLVHLLGSLGGLVSHDGLAIEDNGLGTMSHCLGSFCLVFPLLGWFHDSFFIFQMKCHATF
jgi:hypothetical protein